MMKRLKIRSGSDGTTVISGSDLARVVPGLLRSILPSETNSSQSVAVFEARM